jgi:hypothetical protein
MKVVAGAVGAVLIIILAAVIYWLVTGAGNLSAVRDVSIIFLAVFTLIAVILIGVMAGLLIWLVILLKDRVIPLLEKGQGTLDNVKGTVGFVGENVASPIIKIAGAAAGAKGVVQGLVGKKR